MGARLAVNNNPPAA